MLRENLRSVITEPGSDTARRLDWRLLRMKIAKFWYKLSIYLSVNSTINQFTQRKIFK